MTSHYEALNVARDASADQIAQAFRRTAALWHPDRAPQGREPEYREKFQQAEAARTVLMDREKRAKYDATLSAPASKGILACVSEKDFTAAGTMTREIFRSDRFNCLFCDDEREVRVGMGGFWNRKPCPVCAKESV